MSSQNSTRMIAKTVFGLEPILADELTALGATRIEELNRSVAFDGNTEMLYKANMCCRTATRVLLPIAQFEADSEKQIYRNVAKIDWTRYLDPNMTLAIDTVLGRSRLSNGLYVSQLAKDAIVDQFRDRTGERPSVDTKNPDLRINLHIHEDRASLALDSSNEPLNRRGYRTAGGQAPLSEALAAGILKLIDWNCDKPLVDGMCGSGTFVIEAALMARNIVPGVLRGAYGFMRWKSFDRALFSRIRDELIANVRDRASCEIVGSDIDRKQVQLAQGNAKRAGVDNDIRFAVRAFDEQLPPETPGVLVMNPPYGERIQTEDLEALYSEIGDTLKQKYNGYNAYLFTGNLAAAKRVGLRASRRIVLYNGPIEARLLKYEMYRGTREDRD